MPPEQLEEKRIEAVHRFLEVEYDNAKEFQNIVELAAELCEKPVALITLLDKEVNWVKVRTGIDHPVMPRETSFCQYAIQQGDVLVINDASKDTRFDNNPLVHEAPNVRFYAGAPLTISSGMRLGTLCLFDAKPGIITEQQEKTLAVLSRQVVYLMELELSHKILKEQLRHIEEKNESLQKIAAIQSHEIRQPLTSIIGLLSLIKEDGYKADKEHIIMMEEAAKTLDERIHDIVENTGVHK